MIFLVFMSVVAVPIEIGNVEKYNRNEIMFCLMLLRKKEKSTL